MIIADIGWQKQAEVTIEKKIIVEFQLFPTFVEKLSRFLRGVQLYVVFMVDTCSTPEMFGVLLVDTCSTQEMLSSSR